jgi:hypothetical protein
MGLVPELLTVGFFLESPPESIQNTGNQLLEVMPS